MSIIDRVLSIVRGGSKNEAPLTIERDIHTHILPGVDDGSRSFAESVKIVEFLQKQNKTEVIYCTPHLYDARYSNTFDSLQIEFRTFKENIKKQFPDMEFILSGENKTSYEFLEAIKRGDNLSIFDNNKILIEDSFTSKSRFFDEIVYLLQLKGLTVVLAHPERYFHYHDKNLREYTKLIDKGILFQINQESFHGRYGNEVKLIANRLKTKEMYSFIASDMHHYIELK